jgi:hypothetical protein
VDSSARYSRNLKDIIMKRNPNIFTKFENSDLITEKYMKKIVHDYDVRKEKKCLSQFLVDMAISTMQQRKRLLRKELIGMYYSYLIFDRLFDLFTYVLLAGSRLSFGD